MNNVYFAKKGLFNSEHAGASDIFVAAPLTAYLVYVTEKPKEDNFLADTISQLKKINCGIDKIAGATGLDRTLVQRFIDQTGIKRNEASPKNGFYVFYDRLANRFLQKAVSSRDFHAGIKTLEIESESSKQITIKESISSSKTRTVYLLPPLKDDHPQQPTVEIVRSIVSKTKAIDSDNNILQIELTPEERDCFVITKIFFNELNTNRFLTQGYFEKGEDPTVYDAILPAIQATDNLKHSVETRLLRLKQSCQEKKRKDAASLKARYFNEETLGKNPRLATIISEPIAKYIDASDEKGVSKSILANIALVSACYDAFEELLCLFIANNSTSKGAERFHNLFDVMDDKMMTIDKAKAYLSETYCFRFKESDELLRQIRGASAIEDVLTTIHEGNGKNVFINIPDLVLLAAILAETDEKKYPGMYNFSSIFPYLFDLLRNCLPIRNHRHNSREDNLKNEGLKPERIKQLALSLYSAVLTFVRDAFGVGSGKGRIAPGSYELRAEKDVNQTYGVDTLKMGPLQEYGCFADYVKEIKDCFDLKATGTDLFDAGYNAFSDFVNMLFRYELYESDINIDPRSYLGNLQDINSNLYNLGSADELEDGYRIPSIKINLENYEGESYKKYAFATLMGYMAENDPQFLKGIFQKVPDLVSLYQKTRELRGHNNQIESPGEYEELTDFYQRLIDSLKELKNIEYLIKGRTLK